MSGISGYPSQEKLTTQLAGYDDLNSKTSSQFVTVSQTHDKHVVQDVRINGAFRTTALVKTLTSVATDFPLRVLVSTGHGAQKGDFVRFEGTAANPHFAAMIIDTPDADTMIIGATLPVTPVSGDEFYILRHVVPLYDEDGTLSVSSGPIQFIRDGLSQQVIEDTVTPANNVPLPVKLTSVTGDINITAGDLNVQLSDTGANPDITRIGDGTNRLVMTAAGEATTYDATAEAELININIELDLQTALLTTIDADTGAIATSTASIDTKLTDVNTELDSQTALLTTIDADTGAIATSTASIDGKLPATLGQQTAAASLGVVLASDQVLPLPTGAATEATLASIDGKDFASEATLAAIAADIANINGTVINGEVSARLTAILSANIATTTPLGSGASYTSGSEELLNYENVGLSIETDQNGTAFFEYSQDNVTWYATFAYPITVATPGTPESFYYQVVAKERYFRLRYVNGGTAQGVFRVQAILRQIGGVGEVQAVGQALVGQESALVTKGVIYGLSSGGGGSYVAVKVNPSGAIQTSPTGRTVVTTTRNDYSVTPVTTSVWTQLIASTSAAINEIEIFDSSGQTLELGIGAASSETRLIYIFPGGNGRVLATINSGTRISIRAVSANATVGESTINYYA